MKLVAILGAALLGSVTALALPTGGTLGEFLPAVRRSTLTDRLEALFTRDSTVTYNENWAGAVLSGAGYRTVVGTIQVPGVKLPPGANSNFLHAVSAWVGIDGAHTCPNAVLQVGVDMYINHSTSAYWAWFEWYPSRSTYLTDFAIRPGDNITMNVTATSLSSATLSVTNHRTGQRDSATLADQAPMLCGLSAEWVVEDFWGSNGVPLVDFGSIAFTGARFATDTGVMGGAQGSRMHAVKEKEDGPVVVECAVVGGNEVKCDYKGGSSP